jgi:hypothetical protein
MARNCKTWWIMRSMHNNCDTRQWWSNERRTWWIMRVSVQNWCNALQDLVDHAFHA